MRKDEKITGDRKSLWGRLGVTFELTEAEYRTLCNGGSAAHDLIRDKVDRGCFALDGESYFPALDAGHPDEWSLKDEITLEFSGRGENRYFYTFGSDEQFPYQLGWVVVYANTWEEAHQKFRARFPDRPGHEGTLNCAFFYDEESWSAKDAEHNWPGWKCCEVIE